MRYPRCLLAVLVIFSCPYLGLGESQKETSAIAASTSSDRDTTTRFQSVAAVETKSIVFSSSFTATTASPTTVAAVSTPTVDSDAGASGGNGGSWGISKAAIGVICGIVGLVVIFAGNFLHLPNSSLLKRNHQAKTFLPVGTTALYIHAHKQNMTLRQSLSHTSKRVVTALTPTASRFPRGPPPATQTALGPSISTRLRRSGRQSQRARRTASSNVLGGTNFLIQLPEGDEDLSAWERRGAGVERGRVMMVDPPAYAREDRKEDDVRTARPGTATKGGLRIDTARAQDLEKGDVVREKGKWEELGGLLGRLWK